MGPRNSVGDDRRRDSRRIRVGDDHEVVGPNDELGAGRDHRSGGQRTELGAAIVIDRQERRFADEPGDEAVCRAVEDLVGWTQLLDAPGPHHSDAVADGQCVGPVVGDQQGRRGRQAQDVRDLGAQPTAQIGVEAGERLVEQHEARPWGEGTGERDPLALAAGQLVGVAVAVVGHADDVQPLRTAPGPIGARDAAQPERDVAGHRQVGEQGMLLKDETCVAELRVDPADAVVDDGVADADRAGVDVGQSGDESQQRRLPASARPDDGNQLGVADGEVEVIDSENGPECLAHGAQLEDVVGHRRSRWRLRMATGTRATRMIVSAGSAACSNRDSEARS